MDPLVMRSEDDSKTMLRQMGIFSVFTIVVEIIAMIYTLIKLNQEYGALKVSLSSEPQGRLIKRVDIPVINIYMNIQAEVAGVWSWIGHFWF